MERIHYCTFEDDAGELLWRFTAYIELAVKHARIDYLRKHNRRNTEVSIELIPEHELGSYEDSMPTGGNSGFDFEDENIAAAFSRLSSLRRDILTLVFCEGLSAGETADRLGCSAEHVYLHKHRALKALRDQIINGGENEKQ
jgi:RNA polymerase sigma factor (sigma-70 family)